jgi:hypothetical protein
MRVLALAIVALVGCKGDGGRSDGSPPFEGDAGPETCQAPNRWVYSSPGCGAGAPAPICVAPNTNLACDFVFCSCDGATLLGGEGPDCKSFHVPYRSTGRCPDRQLDAGSATDGR